MSYFNKEQEEYINGLAAVPMTKKCWCCWYLLGECPNCPPGVTGADKMAVRCPDPKCHAAPSPPPNGKVNHTIGCSTRKK